MDQRYESALRGIVSYTDDAIFFAKLLGDDLSKHATKLKNDLPARLRVRAPVITSASYDKTADIMPDPAKYSDWDTMFQTKTEVPPPKPWWKLWA